MEFESANLPGNIVQLSLNGRLDMQGTETINVKFTYLTTVNPGKFIVDLSQVSFLASIGIRMLLTCARAQSSRGGKMVLAAPQPAVRKVIEAAGVDQLVPVLADIETAKASLGE